MMRILAVLLGMFLSGCGTYKTTVMEPWLGAQESELVSAWGYPTSSNDIVKIDEITKLYTYRYETGFGAYYATCRITFTLTDTRVSRWAYNGADCPRIKRR